MRPAPPPSTCRGRLSTRAVSPLPRSPRRRRTRCPHCAVHRLARSHGDLLSRSSEAMGEPSKELLDLPLGPKPPSFIESLFAGREQHKEERKRKAGPPTNPLPKSQGICSSEDGDDEPEMSNKEKCGNPDKLEAHPAKGKKPNKRQKNIVLN